VLANDGRIEPLSAIKRAELYRQDQLLRYERSQIYTNSGLQIVRKQIEELYNQIAVRISAISSQNYMSIRCSKSESNPQSMPTIIATTDEVGTIASWYQPYSNVPAESCLMMREYDIALYLHGEHPIYGQAISPVNELAYPPELSIAREYGWKEKGSSQFLSNEALAEKCVIRLVERTDDKQKQ
jgi:hypothetical protein